MLREENETRNPQSANPARVCREAASVQPLVTSSSPVIHAEKNDAPREGKNAPSIRAASVSYSLTSGSEVEVRLYRPKGHNG